MRERSAKQKGKNSNKRALNEKVNSEREILSFSRLHKYTDTGLKYTVSGHIFEK